MYLFKQAVGLLTTPLVLALLIAAIAAACRIFKRPRAAFRLFCLALGVAFLSALGVVGDILIGPLERRYVPLAEDSLAQTPGYIVVLGSNYSPRDGIPITAALDTDGLTRAVEGIRLEQRFPGATLVLSGGAPAGAIASAIGYTVLARSLGIAEQTIVTLPESLDTRQEAQAVVKLVGATPFILVTSAYHMPRAMKLMERVGAHPIPAPTGQRVNLAFNARSLLPSAGGLSKTERAVHEYVGLMAIAVGIQ